MQESGFRNISAATSAYVFAIGRDRPGKVAMLAAQPSPVSGVVFAVTVLATSMALVAGLSWASRRLLGLPVGAVRTLIAGLLGVVAVYVLGRALPAASGSATTCSLSRASLCCACSL